MSKLVSAKVIREFFASNPDKAPESAAKSLAQGARGRIHPDAVKVFSQANKGKAYDASAKVRDTASVTLKVKGVTATGKSHTKLVKVPASEARTLAGTDAGKRGRLSTKAVEAAAAAFASKS